MSMNRVDMVGSRSILIAPLALWLIIGAGCSDGTSAPPVPITVSITTSATEADAGATVTLSAKVANSRNEAVRWQTSGGSLTPTGGTATFVAPFTGGSFVITATSLADTTRVATVTITVREIAVSLTPSTITLGAAEVQTFTATVANSVNTDVRWSATRGTITGTGRVITYTAPVQGGTDLLTVISTADSTRRASTTITITPVVVRLTPDSATLTRGERRTLTAVVTGTSLTGVTWEGSCPSVAGTGNTVVVAPTSPGTCSLTARSVTDVTAAATASVLLRPVFLVTAFDDVDDGGCTSAHCSLREAMTAANVADDLDSILIAPLSPLVIQLSSALPVITRPTHVVGAGSARVTLDAAASVLSPRRVLDVNGLIAGSITGLTLRGGVADAGAGVSLQRVTDWELRDVVVMRNEARGSVGGGIRASAGARVRLRAVVIDSNRASTALASGAGLGVVEGASVRMTGGRITENVSDATGAGARVVDAQLILDSVLVSRNRATDNGGGLAIERSTGAQASSVSRSTLEANTASGGGGLVLGIGTDLAMVNSNVRDNTAVLGNGGGALVQRGGRLQLTSSTVSGNRATRQQGGGIALEGGAELSGRASILEQNAVAAGQGGGLYASGAVVTLTGMIVRGNTSASGSGGGLALFEGTTWRMTDGTILENTAPAGSGGGAFIGGIDARLDSVELRGNTAFASGGGVTVLGNTTAVLDRVTFTLNRVLASNSSTDGIGGALYAVGNATISIVNSLFTFNSAAYGGGAIEWLNSGTLSIADSRFQNNSAAVTGGAIESRGTGPVVILRSTVSDNGTGNGPGGGLAFFGPFTVEQSTISNNRASNSTGGGIYVQGSGPNAIRNSTISGNIAGVGGGIAAGGTTALVQLAHVTLVGNRAFQQGGGVGIFTPQGGLLFANTLLAGNSGPLGSSNCSGPSSPSLGGNLSDDATCIGLVLPTDRSNVPPGVSPTLSANGGSTSTHALLQGSAAINAGISPFCLPKDQRGWTRVGPCDIGAFEFGASPLAPRPAARK